MNTLQLKPAEGRLVRDPVTGAPLAAGGETKPDTPFWRRRLRDGDVLQVATPSAEASAKVERGGKAK